MTVASSVNKAIFSGSNSTGPFTFGFKFWSNDEIYVQKTSVALAVTSLVEVTDYTLTGAGVNTGGSVTLVTALATGETLTIWRVLDYLQEQAFTNQGAFYPELHEVAFDKVVMLIQQLKEQLQRSIKAPIDEAEDMTLPTGDRANTAIGFDANGDLKLFAQTFNTVNVPSVGTSTALDVDATGGDQIVYLPASGEMLYAKSDATANKVIVEPAVVGQTIEGFAIGDNAVYLDTYGQTGRWILLGTNWYRQ